MQVLFEQVCGQKGGREWLSSQEEKYFLMYILLNFVHNVLFKKLRIFLQIRS